MTLTVQSLAIDLGAPLYWQEAWHIVLESHLLFLSDSTYATLLSIDPHDAFIFEGDLWGVLQAYGVAPQYHWAVMRANGLYSPTEYTREMVNLVNPSSTFIDQLRNLYQTISNKLN